MAADELRMWQLEAALRGRMATASMAAGRETHKRCERLAEDNMELRLRLEQALAFITVLSEELETHGHGVPAFVCGELEDWKRRLGR